MNAKAIHQQAILVLIETITGLSIRINLSNCKAPFSFSKALSGVKDAATFSLLASIAFHCVFSFDGKLSLLFIT